ncbi:MAG: hypothetical protein LBB65_01720 [Burkholderiales bacterium]|jgi:hypothetical protein|nr:hypothetical protein [Burkholderiales bacterium]
MFNFFRRFLSRAEKNEMPAKALRHGSSSPISVAFDERGVSLFVKGQIKQTIAWDEIEMIAVCIEDAFLPFPYWYVGNEDNLLRISNDAVGGTALFVDGFCEHISGYKSDTTFNAIIKASAAMEGAFIIWQAKDTAQHKETQ